MPDPVRITYETTDGRDVVVQLDQHGHRQVWALQVEISESGVLVADHEHAIQGEPEVRVG